MVGGAVILIIGALIFSGYHMLEAEKEPGITGEEIASIPDGSPIDFQLYDTYKVDASALRERLHVVEGTPFTYFIQIYSLDSWKQMSEFQDIHFDFSQVDFGPDDFQDKYFVASFGREVVEIQKLRMAYDYLDLDEDENTTIEAAVTFGEEYYDQTMFLYVMDRIHLLEGMANECYIMDGSEKVFKAYDILDFNEHIPWDEL